MYNQIVVCEGLHDVIKIQSAYPDLKCIITNGSEISDDTLKMIKEYSKKYEMILFFDPDFPGERIRNKILEIVPNAKNAYIKKELCISRNNKKVGVEHASASDIKEILEPLLNKSSAVSSDLELSNLIELDIMGNKKLRMNIASYYNIGNPNNKTLLKRLKSLGINRSELEEVIKRW